MDQENISPKLHSITNYAIKLVEDGVFPIFSQSQICCLHKSCVAIDISLTLQPCEEDWSLDVFDDSGPNPLEGDTSTFVRHADTSDCNRMDIIFFLSKSWSESQRLLFSAMNLTRWFFRKLISFTDLVRVVNEIECVFQGYFTDTKFAGSIPQSPSITDNLNTLPNATSFICNSTIDPNDIYVEIAFDKPALIQKMGKFKDLVSGDPVKLPPNLSFLHSSVTSNQIGIKHLKHVENLTLGNERVSNWDFSISQRFADADDPHVELTYLLHERRRNPNLKIDSEIDYEAENEARAAKIWSQYDQDFMFRICKYSVPYVLGQKDIQILHKHFDDGIYTESTHKIHGEATSKQQLDGCLEEQLLQTQITQVEDVLIEPFKSYDDVEVRQSYLKLFLQQKAKNPLFDNSILDNF